MMYEAPIKAIYGEWQSQLKNSFDSSVIRAVQNVGIDIDREELIKALQYDRGQYDKGFADGLEVAKKHGRWIYHISDLFPAESTQECSECHVHEFITIANENYCPNCGAKMDAEVNNNA